MNKFTALRNLLLVAWFIHLTSFGVLAQIGIGLPAGEEPQSALDVRFDSAVSPGFLMPRVTSLPTGDIAEGMLIYYCSGCTDTDGDGQVNYENGSYYVYVDNDGNGTSEWTELASNAGVVEVDNTSPTAPTNLAASNPSTTTIDLSWTVSTDNVGVAGYFIYLNDGTLVTTAPSNSITVTGLEANTSYTFYVTAYDAAMNESTSSNTASETTQSGCVQTTICTATFETGFDCWNDGGSGASRTTAQSNTGSYSVELNGNSSSANISSNSFDFSSFTTVTIAFYLMATNFEPGDKVYIDISTGGSWVEEVRYQGFGNGTWVSLSRDLTGLDLTQSTSIRIRNGSNKADETLWVDDITITGYCD